jgi:chemotaxis protein histidine kinase CheA
LRLQIPTALAVMQLLICLVQQTPVAFPAAQLQEIILAPVGPTSSDRAPTVVWQGQAIPIYCLDDRLSDLPAQPHPESPLSATKFPAHWPAPVLIVAGSRPVAFEVSALVNQQEVMVNPPKPAAAPAYLHGHAILENGTTIPVIDGWMLAELLKIGADPH